MVKRTDSEGEPVRGERKINEAEAAIVCRIFREFAVGKSPRAGADACPFLFFDFSGRRDAVFAPPDIASKPTKVPPLRFASAIDRGRVLSLEVPRGPSHGEGPPVRGD